MSIVQWDFPEVTRVSPTAVTFSAPRTPNAVPSNDTVINITRVVYELNARTHIR